MVGAIDAELDKVWSTDLTPSKYETNVLLFSLDCEIKTDNWIQ